MDYAIEYYDDEVEEQILALPDTLAARYVVLTRRMAAVGANLGQPTATRSAKVCSSCG